MSRSTSSPQEYAQQHQLQSLLSQCVNDCYLTQSTCPAATMAQLLKSTYAVDTLNDVSLTEVLDGDSGGYTVEVNVALASGQTATTTASHSNATLPFHPSSARRPALLPRSLLLQTGKGSLAAALAPPVAPPPPPLKKGDPKQAAPVEVHDTGHVTSVAVQHATRCRLTASVAFFDAHIRPALLSIRAANQRAVDDLIARSDAKGPFRRLLAQVAAALSLCVAKAAAASLNKPLALYIGGLYQATNAHAANDAREGAGPGPLAVPDLIITILSSDPRSMGKVRCREVCLIVHAQTGAGRGTLTMDQVQTAHCIAADAVSRAAAVVAGMCSLSAADVEATMMPVQPDGSVRMPFFDSVSSMVACVEEAIRATVGAIGPAAGYSVGLVVDAALSYRPATQKYALVADAEITGAQLAETLASLVTAPERAGVLTYLEDTHAPSDFEGLRRLMHRVGGDIVVSGNHLFASSASLLAQCAQTLVANHATLRLNDVGCLSALLESACTFRGMYRGATVGLTGEVVEGDGAALAHVAVGMHASMLRCGGLFRRAHAGILNELLRISAYLERSGVSSFGPRGIARPVLLPPAPVDPVVEAPPPAPTKRRK